MIIIFGFGKKRKSPELRADSNETALLSFFGAYNELDKKSTLEIPTVSACINKIADTVSSLPVKLYQRKDGTVTEISDDFRIKLLNGETGDTMNTADIWKSAVEDYFVGKGAWIFINSDGLNVKSLHYVSNDFLSILSNSDPIFKAFNVLVNGRKYYDFQFIRLLRKTKNGWDNIPIQAENSAILSASYNSLKLENSMSANGGCKSGFLKAKTRLSREAIDEIKGNYASMYDNAKQKDKKVVVLNDGIDFQEISATSAELQMNENKKANSVEICKLFGFPHTVIDGNASEDDNKKFTSAVIALLNQIETALDSSLLLESEKENGFYWAFDTKELTRGSIKERFEAYDIAVRNNILQIDEIRREEDFEPIGFNFLKLGLGDVLYSPVTKTVFTPNTSQTANLATGEVRAEELRGWITKNGKHIFIGDNGGGGAKSESGISGKHSTKTDENTVDLDYINSDDFKNKFKGITNNTKVNEQIYSQSKAMLIHRNGTNKEDMCLINSETGKIEGRQTHSKSDFGVDYNESLNNAVVNNAPYSLISIHNHPTNNPPTGSDLVSNGSKKYKLGLVVTHNGRVFTYKVGNNPFLPKSFDSRVDENRKKGYNEFNAIIETLNQYVVDYGIEWSER